MNLIVCVDKNWGIGKDGKLLCHLKEDMKFFREHTLGKVVVMGRKTLESFPREKLLPGRKNIVLTRKEHLQVRGAEIARSLQELLKILDDYKDEDIFVIGGGEIYRQLLPYSNVVHVTKVHHSYRADTWFPALDKDPCWAITADIEEQTYFEVEFEFLKYERVHPDSL